MDEDRSDNAPLMNVEKSTMQPFFPCSNTKKVQAGLIVNMQPDIYVLRPRLGGSRKMLQATAVSVCTAHVFSGDFPITLDDETSDNKRTR